MAQYNLTGKQKDLLITIVEHIEEGKVDEPILPICTFTECSIIGIDKNFGHNLVGDLDALCDVDLMSYRFTNKGNKIYSVKHAGYEAVKNDFAFPEASVNTQYNIGAIVHKMSGGNLQGIGLSDQSEINQIVNDPKLLKEQVDSITNQLLEIVRIELSADKLIPYMKALEDIKEEINSEEPSPSKLQGLINSLAFMGDIEGAISLAARVWPYIYPLLVIAAQKAVNGN